MKSSENIVFKRIAFVLIILLGIVTVLVSFAGCNRLFVGDKNAVGIKIQSNPYKMQYNRGETFDISGLTIFEVYESGAEIIITDYTTTPAAGEILNEAGYFEGNHLSPLKPRTMIMVIEKNKRKTRNPIRMSSFVGCRVIIYYGSVREWRWGRVK